MTQNEPAFVDGTRVVWKRDLEKAKSPPHVCNIFRIVGRPRIPLIRLKFPRSIPFVLYAQSDSHRRVADGLPRSTAQKCASASKTFRRVENRV